jgi:hypothetical protein
MKEETAQSNVQIHKDMGYLIAKMESLDAFIREHMSNEEDRFAKIDKSIKRLSGGMLVISLILVLDAFGIPTKMLILKLLGIAL